VRQSWHCQSGGSASVKVGVFRACDEARANVDKMIGPPAISLFSIGVDLKGEAHPGCRGAHRVYRGACPDSQAGSPR